MLEFGHKAKSVKSEGSIGTYNDLNLTSVLNADPDTLSDVTGADDDNLEVDNGYI